MKKYLYCLNCIVFIIGFFYSSQAQMITTFAGNGAGGYSGDGGAATLAQLDSPTCLAMDLSGNVYISDQFNNRVRKVTPAGIITTVAGSGVNGYSGDGGPATAARLSQNWGIAVDAPGNLYIVDHGNHRVRKVSTTGIITTIAGTGIDGYTGDGGPATAARLRYPMGVAVDATGNVFITDANNYCIRKINPAGVISNYAGTPGTSGYSGDGGMATAARISYSWGIVTDAGGNVYFCDGDNNRIRKVTTSGIITTVAGSGGPGTFAGDGGPATDARFNKPLGLYVAKDGSIFISDCNNNRVRRINTSGIITTIAGNGTMGYNGEGVAATAAYLNHPVGVLMDTTEHVFFSDLGNARVREIINILSFVYGSDEHLRVCQNSGPVSIDEILSVRDIYVGLINVWSLVATPVNGTATASYTTTSTGGILTPMGLTYTPTTGYIGPDSFKVKVANALSSDIITIYVTVDPMLTAGFITGPSSVCFGDTMMLTNSTAGGTWSSLTGKVSLTTVAAGCIVKGEAVGTDSVIYTVTNACGTAKTSKEITIHPLPYPGTVTGPEALCLGSKVVFTAAIPGGTWSTSNSLRATIGSTGALTAQVEGVGAGTVTIAYTVYNTWCSAAAIQVIDIETFPDAGIIDGPVTICLGEQITFTDPVPGGVWSSDLGIVTVTFGLVTGNTVGDDFINYSVTNTCGTDVTSQPISVHPIPEPPTISVDQGVLFATKGYATYRWTFNGAIIPGAGADSLYATIAGAYQVVVTNPDGCAASSVSLDYTGCAPEDLSIYPNPAWDELNIFWCKKITARVVCMDGREVINKSSVNKLDLTALPAGMYLLTIYDTDGTKLRTKKIVKLQ